MGGLAAAGDGSTATGSTQAFSTMGLKPEPLVQTVPDLDDNDVATVDNAISMMVRQPWDELGDFGSSTTSAYPIKAVRIDPLGSSHTHTMFDMSIGDTGSSSSSNNSSFSNVPSYRSNVPSYRRSAEDPYAMLGHGNVLSGTEDDSEEDEDEDSDGGHADAGMGGMDMGEDEGIASYRNAAAASAARKRQNADGPSASSSSSSSSSSKAAAMQKKQLAKQQKTAAAVAAAKARTGPPPAIPTSRDIAAFDPTKVVAIGGGPADDALTAHAHNDTARPPYSYTAIIYRAVDALGKKRVQLGEIYYQIMLSWAYYAARPLETGWKNSIRHNLTVCRCFKKVARAEGESGKGGYWTIDEPFAKIDIQLDPRDASPRLSKKKIKKKSKSRTLADRKEKPLTYSPSSPQISRRSVPSPQMLEAAAVATAATEALSASSSSSLSSSGNEAIFAAPAPTRQGTRSQRTRATRTSTAAAVAAAAATAAAAAAATTVTATATPETVYPTHLLAHTFEEDATDFSPREHDDAGNPLPAIPRGPGHTTRIVLPASELDESFSALAGMSLNLSSSFGNAMLGNSLGGSNVLNASFSNLLAGGQLID